MYRMSYYATAGSATTHLGEKTAQVETHIITHYKDFGRVIFGYEKDGTWHGASKDDIIELVEIEE